MDLLQRCGTSIWYANFNLPFFVSTITFMKNVPQIIKAHGKGVHEARTIKSGHQTIHDHGDAIMAASFSPDGTALATASADGEVKFFQVYMHGDEGPRCLHKWKPHDGKPVSILYFLDNHKVCEFSLFPLLFAIGRSHRNRVFHYLKLLTSLAAVNSLAHCKHSVNTVNRL